MASLRELFADTAPLKNPHFSRLWWANIVTVIGAQLTVVVVPAQIYHLTGSSAYVGLTGLFGLVPLVVFGLWGGALADAMDRRVLQIITTLGLILTSGLFWLVSFLGNPNVWILLTIFAVQQAFFAVNQPTRAAILPKLLPAHQLPAANALNMTVMMFGAVAGPMIGGVLIPILGYAWLYLFDTLTLLATLWAVWKLPPMAPDNAIASPGLKSVVDGFRYLAGHPVLLMSFVVDIIAMVFGMPRALFPELASVSFGGPSEGGLAFALLSAAIPLGAVVGGVFSGWVSKVQRQGLAVVVCIIVWGVGIALFGLACLPAGGRLMPWILPAFVLLTVAGAADMASASFRQTMLQSAANDDVRGRLQGVFIVVVAGGPRLADVLHGWVAGSIGAGWTTAIGGILVIILVIVAAMVVPAFVRYRVTPTQR